MHDTLTGLIKLYKKHGVRVRTSDNPLSFLDEDEYDLVTFFECKWLWFPHPFKRGDIVINCLYNENKYHGRYCNGPFVLDHITGADDKGCDCTDMNGVGYFQDEKGNIYYESMWNYMDLELYKGKLSGHEKLLYAVSNYMKNEIDLALLLAAQRILVLEREGIEEPMPYMYTDEGLRLAGLKE